MQSSVSCWHQNKFHLDFGSESQGSRDMGEYLGYVRFLPRDISEEGLKQH